MPFPGYVTAHWPSPGQPVSGLGFRDASRRGLESILGSVRLVTAQHSEATALQALYRGPVGGFYSPFIFCDIGGRAIPPSPERDGPFAEFLWRWSSIRDLFGPKSSDRAELPLDCLRDTPELRGDLGVGVPFHLPPRYRAQRVIAQAAIEPPAFLGHLDRQLGVELGIEDLFDTRFRQIREDEHPAGAPFRSTLAAYQVDRLAHGDDDQQLPKVVAVVELRELAAFGPLIEALEGAESHILLVGRAARGAPEMGAGETDQPLEVALPELLGGGPLPSLEQLDAVGDRPFRRHRHRAPRQVCVVKPSFSRRGPHHINRTKFPKM